MNAIIPNNLDIRKIGQPLTAAANPQSGLSDLARQLTNDLLLVINENDYGVTAEEIGAFCEAVNAEGGKGQTAVAALIARLAASPRKLEFFIRLVSFLTGRTADFRQKSGIVVSKETLVQLLADNQKLQKVLADYAAYKAGALNVETSESDYLSIRKGDNQVLLDRVSGSRLTNLLSLLKESALVEAKKIVTDLFEQPVAALRSLKDGVEIKFADGKTVVLTHKELELFRAIKQNQANLASAQSQGADKQAEIAMINLSLRLQELAGLDYTFMPPSIETMRHLRKLKDQNIDLAAMHAFKPAPAALTLKKGKQKVIFPYLTADRLKSLDGLLKDGATAECKPTIAGLLDVPASRIKTVAQKDGKVVVAFNDEADDLDLSQQELALISRLNKEPNDPALRAELQKLGYKITSPTEESTNLRYIYQTTGRKKVLELRNALAPFEALSRVKITGDISREAELLTTATRLHAALDAVKQDISYIYTTLNGLAVKSDPLIEKYVKSDQEILGLITDEERFGKFVAKLEQALGQKETAEALGRLGEQAGKTFAAKRENFQRLAKNRAFIEGNKHDKAALFDKKQPLHIAAIRSEELSEDVKTEVIKALFGYARAPFRGRPDESWIELGIANKDAYNNLASFREFVAGILQEYALPDTAGKNEEAAKAAEADFNSTCEVVGKTFWAKRQHELKDTLAFTSLPLPRLRGKLNEKYYFSDGLVRLISLRAERLPGNYSSDAAALAGASIIGQDSRSSLEPLFQAVTRQSGQPIELTRAFFTDLLEEKAAVIFLFDTVKNEPVFYSLRRGKLSVLKPEGQALLKAFWELSYRTEQQDEKLTLKGKLMGAVDLSLSAMSEAEIERFQIETLAFKMAAFCVDKNKVKEIGDLSEKDINEVLTTAYQLLQAGRKAEEIEASFKADIKKNEDALTEAEKKFSGQVNKEQGNLSRRRAADEFSGGSFDAIAEDYMMLDKAAGQIGHAKAEQGKKFQEYKDSIKKAKERFELAQFFIEKGRRVFGANVNPIFLTAVAGRVKNLLDELPVTGAKGMLADFASPRFESSILTPALLRASIFASAGNQFSKQNVAGQASAPDAWDRALLNDIPLVGKTKVNSEQGLYGIVLNHPATAVLAYLSDELHYDFWSEQPKDAAGRVSLNIQASISGDFLMRLGGHLVKKYGDRFQYMIAAGQALKERNIVLGDKEVETPTTINPGALGLAADDQLVKAISSTLQFLNGVYQVSMRKFQPMEGDMLARSFELKDKTLWNRLSGVGRSTFKIPLSGAQKQLQTIIGQDIMLMREELGLPYPATGGPESFEIDQKFVKALLDSPFSSYLRHSYTAGFFGQLGEKADSKVGREAAADPEKFLKEYLAEHPEFSFSLDLGFEDVIDERTAWAKLLIMKALSNYAVSESNPASRAAKKLGHLPEADTVFSIFLQQDMMDPGNWNRPLNIFLYQTEQLVPGAGITLKHNHEYTSAQVNFLGRKMLETVQNLPAESKLPILEQVNDIFNASRQGKDKEAIDKGMTNLEQVARLLADYQGDKISFESIGLTGGFDQVRKALYTLTRVFLPMMSARAKGEAESKVVAGRFLQHYRQELKAGHELIVENFLTAPERAGRFQHAEKAEEGYVGVLAHSATEMVHLHLFMHPEIMIGLQAGFLRSFGKALAEGRHGDAVEVLWQQINMLASFKAFELFPPALIASGVEKIKQGNTGGAIIQFFFAWTAFKGLYNLTRLSWRTLKRGRYLVSGEYGKTVQARIARLETAMAQLPAKMNELGQKMMELRTLVNGKAAPADVAAKFLEVKQAQAEVNALLDRTAKNAEAPQKTLKKAAKHQQKKLPQKLMADKYTRGGKAETRVSFEVFEADGTTSIATPKRGLGNRTKGLSPIRANNRVVDVIWNAEDLAVEGMTLGGAKVFQNQDMARVTNLLEKMVELAGKGDQPIKVRFSSISEGAAVIEIRPSQVVRSFYIQHQSVTHKLASIPDAIQLGKPLRAGLNYISKKLGGKGVAAIPGTNESAKHRLAQELLQKADQATVNKWFNSVQTQASYCSTRIWNVPAKLFNARGGVTRVFAQLYRRLLKAQRKGYAPIATAPAAPQAASPAGQPTQAPAAPRDPQSGFVAVESKVQSATEPVKLNPKAAAAWAKYEKLVKDGKIMQAKALSQAEFAKYYNGCKVFEKALGFVMTVAIIQHIAHSDNKAEAIARVATGFAAFLGAMKATDKVVGKFIKHPVYRFAADLAIAAGLTAGADKVIIDPIIKKIGIELNGTNWEALGGAAGYFFDILGGGPALAGVWNMLSKPDDEREFLDRSVVSLTFSGSPTAYLNDVHDWNVKVGAEIAAREAKIAELSRTGKVTTMEARPAAVPGGITYVNVTRPLTPEELASKTALLQAEIKAWRAKQINGEWDKRQAFQLGQKLALLSIERDELTNAVKQMRFLGEDERKLLGVLENLEAFALANTVHVGSEVYKLAEYVIMPDYLDRGVKEPRNEFKDRLKELIKGYKAAADDVAFYNRIGRRYIADNWNNRSFIEEEVLRLLAKL